MIWGDGRKAGQIRMSALYYVSHGALTGHNGDSQDTADLGTPRAEEESRTYYDEPAGSMSIAFGI